MDEDDENHEVCAVHHAFGACDLKLPKVPPDKCVLGPESWDQCTVGWLANAGITLEKQASDNEIPVRARENELLRGRKSERVAYQARGRTSQRVKE